MYTGLTGPPGSASKGRVEGHYRDTTGTLQGHYRDTTGTTATHRDTTGNTTGTRQGKHGGQDSQFRSQVKKVENTLLQFVEYVGMTLCLLSGLQFLFHL